MGKEIWKKLSNKEGMFLSQLQTYKIINGLTCSIKVHVSKKNKLGSLDFVMRKVFQKFDTEHLIQEDNCRWVNNFFFTNVIFLSKLSRHP